MPGRVASKAGRGSGRNCWHAAFGWARSAFATLMSLHGIGAQGKRQFKATTHSNHKLPVAPNLVDRQFKPATPNAVWRSDITSVATDEGWLSLAVIIDLFGRQVVGWSMQPHMRRELVIDALHMAWLRRHPPPGLICHSDRASPYCNADFHKALTGYGMRSSMRRKGNCWDNAPTGKPVGLAQGGQAARQTLGRPGATPWRRSSSG